jgi:hypothetical protein
MNDDVCQRGALRKFRPEPRTSVSRTLLSSVANVRLLTRAVPCPTGAVASLKLSTRGVGEVLGLVALGKRTGDKIAGATGNVSIACERGLASRAKGY